MLYFYRMNRTITLMIAVTGFFLTASCSGSRDFKKDRALFENSAVTGSYRSLTDMNDAFFELRENNFFEFYRRLFDSVKNSSYPGRYTRSGDTLFLHFYNKKGEDILGSKALISADKKEVIFFDNSPGKKRLIFN